MQSADRQIESWWRWEVVDGDSYSKLSMTHPCTDANHTIWKHVNIYLRKRNGEADLCSLSNRYMDRDCTYSAIIPPVFTLSKGFWFWTKCGKIWRGYICWFVSSLCWITKVRYRLVYCLDIRLGKTKLLVEIGIYCPVGGSLQCVLMPVMRSLCRRDFKPSLWLSEVIKDLMAFIVSRGFPWGLAKFPKKDHSIWSHKHPNCDVEMRFRLAAISLQRLMSHLVH